MYSALDPNALRRHLSVGLPFRRVGLFNCLGAGDAFPASTLQYPNRLSHLFVSPSIPIRS